MSLLLDFSPLRHMPPRMHCEEVEPPVQINLSEAVGRHHHGAERTFTILLVEGPADISSGASPGGAMCWGLFHTNAPR